MDVEQTLTGSVLTAQYSYPAVPATVTKVTHLFISVTGDRLAIGEIHRNWLSGNSSSR